MSPKKGLRSQGKGLVSHEGWPRGAVGLGHSLAGLVPISAPGGARSASIPLIPNSREKKDRMRGGRGKRGRKGKKKV